MIKIERLYTEPEYFKPIAFETGINLIIGDRTEGNPKTNGVGKSMCIEFINYCLLKQQKGSRIDKIPKTQFPLDVKIMLDLVINGNQLTIIRTREKSEEVFIKKNSDEELFFDRISDASDYLKNLFFSEQPSNLVFPSFRQLLSPLIREERSEFKDLISCFDTKKRIPPDYIPHLYLLGFDISVYKEYQNIYRLIDNKTKYIKELKDEITEKGSLKISDVRAKLNALEGEVKKLNAALESLKTNDAYEIIQKDLIVLETDLDKLRIHQKAIKYDIKKMETLPKPENISKTELTILYNQFKQGLGDMIEKSISEMEMFKLKIDNFRNTIVNNKLGKLKTELNQITLSIREKDNTYSNLLQTVDNGKVLKDLKTGISIYNKKSEELNKIRYQMTAYEKAEKDKKNVLKPQLDDLKLQINQQIEENETILNSFEQTILNIHEYIMNNMVASFKIETKSAKRKDYINFEMRIDDDGSHSLERTKVFIYDIALLFNKETRKRHPKLLIHDNIFDVDNDTLVQCLNFLSKQEELYPNDFQYIMTINRDKIEDNERRKLIKLDIKEHRRANFTKDARFLNLKYKEM
jgi:uncharacterized protein YydD (DUF2326 family)